MSSLPELHAAPRSMLFVSGEKPERFAKAMGAGADLVCIDLEDAVGHPFKAQARRDALAFIAAARDAAGPRLALRVNGVRTLEGLRDLLALAESDVALDWLLLPKVEDAADVACAQAWAGQRFGRIAALIETPLGLIRAADIATAGCGLGALMLGGADLSVELESAFDWEGLRHARGVIVNAAKSRQLQAWDVPHIDLPDLDGLADETRRVVGLGFNCKAAIHPNQIAAIHAAFKPSDEQSRWATALLDAVGSADAPRRGAFLFEGRMVDAPVVRKARGIVARAGRG